MKVNVACCMCGEPLQVGYRRYTYNKYHGKPFYCKKCKSKLGNDAKQNFTSEKKAEISKHQSESQKARWANMDPEDRDRIISLLVNSGQTYMSNMTDEQRKLAHDKLQAANSRWWDSLSNEEKERYSKLRSTYSKSYWDNITEEERKEIGKRQSRIVQSYWDSMTNDSYAEWDRKRREGLNKYLNCLPVYMNKTEYAAYNLFRKEGLEVIPKWYNVERHPEFELKFPNNPVTGEDRVSPYHQWDMMINTRNGKVLIDVDGSIHDPSHINYDVTLYNGKRVKLADMIKFNDSKRQYQTDGLDAYVIRVYDDRLTDDAPVFSLQTGEQMSFKTLLAILKFKNKSDDEIKEHMRLVK